MDYKTIWDGEEYTLFVEREPVLDFKVYKGNSASASGREPLGKEEIPPQVFVQLQQELNLISKAFRDFL